MQRLVLDRVCKAVEENPGSKFAALRDGLGLEPRYLDRVLQQLKRDGRIVCRAKWDSGASNGAGWYALDGYPVKVTSTRHRPRMAGAL